MKVKIWRDDAGAIVHIGEWDEAMAIEAVATTPPPEGARAVRRKSFRDGDGALIHSGEWPTDADGVPSPMAEGVVEGIETVWIDAAGSEIGRGAWDMGFAEREVATNPRPEGLTCTMETVIETPEAGRTAASDHAARRRADYPALAEQLDALWKGGEAADAMRARIMAVKDRHPKAGE